MAQHDNRKRLTGPSSGPPGAASANPFDPWILWVAVRRCWPWAVPSGAVLAGIAAFVIMQDFVPRYRASHLLEANQDYVLFKNLLHNNFGNLAGTEKVIIYNPIVMDPVLEDPALREAPSLSDPATAEANLRRNLSVSSAGSAARMVVTYTDNDKAAAAAVCNAVVDSYLRKRNEFDSARMRNLERYLQPEIQRWEREVEERQLKVESLSKSLLGYTPGEQIGEQEHSGRLNLLTKLQTKVADLSFQLALFDAQQAMHADDHQVGQALATAEEMSSLELSRPEPSEDQIAALVSQNGEVREAQSYISKYKSMLLNLELGDRVGINRGYYEKLQGHRDEWTAKLEAAKQKAREAALAKINEQIDDELAKRQQEREAKRAASLVAAEQQRQARIEANAQQRRQLETELQIAQEQYRAESQRMEQFGGNSAKLRFANHSASVANQILFRLRERVAAIETERRKDGAVRTLAAATPPRAPLERLPFKKMMTAAMGCFAIPFALGLLWEFRIQRLTNSSSVDRLNTLAPVVGEVARLPSASRPGRGRRLFEESVDTLRANLLLSVDTRETRSIAVASSMSGEGKSSVASQLAISIAKATGTPVLLVDADLRCPDQHEIFGLELGKGLSAVLSEQVKLMDAVDKSLGKLVHVLPAGALSGSPHRLISSSSMRDFVDQALEHYSYVVIDTAPVLAAGETLAVVSAVDSTLLCVMRDVSRAESVTRTMRRLEAAGANVAGTVFSGISPRQYAYRYGDYSYASPEEEVLV